MVQKTHGSLVSYGVLKIWRFCFKLPVVAPFEFDQPGVVFLHNCWDYFTWRSHNYWICSFNKVQKATKWYIFSIWKRLQLTHPVSLWSISVRLICEKKILRNLWKQKWETTVSQINSLEILCSEKKNWHLRALCCNVLSLDVSVGPVIWQ